VLKKQIKDNQSSQIYSRGSDKDYFQEKIVETKNMGCVLVPSYANDNFYKAYYIR
jgi:hypothetical protein